ncbi:MAG: hypothetical protein HZA81_01890 [Candidatus Taylorbacteria bacterium]|nr:hypothetical protein [Candidatus Taylorbacteria bacterium]
MALMLSDAVAETRKLAHGRNYGQAAAKALRSMGFSKPSISVRVARIVNDIGSPENVSLISAVTSYLGKEGGMKSTANRRQLVLSL